MISFRSLRESCNVSVKLYSTPLTEGGEAEFSSGKADKILMSKHDRDVVTKKIKDSLKDFNEKYAKEMGSKLWDDKAITDGDIFSGSSKAFMSSDILSSDFAKHKEIVSDIDVQVDEHAKETLATFLEKSKNKKFKNSILSDWKASPLGDQHLGLFKLDDPSLFYQIDFELVDFKDGRPTKFASFARSSEWVDIKEGVKGVFHKWLISSLTRRSKNDVIILKGKKETPEKVSISSLAFSVSKGLRDKLEPVMDGSKQKMIDGLPVFKELPTAKSTYTKDLEVIFKRIIGVEPKSGDMEKFGSFMGIISLINTYLSKEKQVIFDRFFEFLFEPKVAQMITKDQKEDRRVKTIAISKLIDGLKLNVNQVDLEKKITAYYGGTVKEDTADSVVKTKRKGLVHLEKMPDLEFVEFFREVNPKLKNLPVTLKVDGVGGRFGKDEKGKPFFENSYSGPVFEPGRFSAYAKTRPDASEGMIDRSKKFDILFDVVIGSSVMAAVPNNTKVICEFLFNPLGEESDSTVKFVSIEYDKSKLGSELTIVPIDVIVASTGEEHPQKNKVISDIMKKSSDKIKVVSPKLVQKGEIDITAIIDPIKTLDDEAVKKIKSLKAADKEEKARIKEIIQVVKEKMAKYILDHPSIVGKDILGPDVEGLVVNLGGRNIKITTQAFKDTIAAKRAQR